jgi:hypothetical protein
MRLKTISDRILMGSLNKPGSFISRLWRVIPLIIKQKNNGIFILQDLQNYDIYACGNSRQRGKIALKIFCKLRFIREIVIKGVSTLYAIGEKRPFNMTLDKFLDSEIQDNGSSDINDPEQYNDENASKEKNTDIYETFISSNRLYYDVRNNNNNKDRE